MTQVVNFKAVKDEKTALQDYAQQNNIAFETWDLDSDIGLKVLQPFLQMGYINDPDFALSKSGTDIYVQMHRDDVIEGSLNIRYKAVSSLDFEINPHPEGEPKKQGEEVKLLSKVIREIPNRSIWIENILTSVLQGSSYNELIWTRAKDGMIVPKIISPLDKQRMVWSSVGELRIKTHEYLVHGAKIVPKSKAVKAGKIMVNQYNIDDATSATAQNLGFKFFGRGVGDALWRLYYIKYNTFGQASRLGERQATGIILLTVPKGTEEENTEISENILNMRKTGLLIQRTDPDNPEAYKIQYLEPSGQGKDFLIKLVNLCNDGIRSLILGQNLTAPGAAGSGTAGAKMVLRDVMLDIKISDIASVEGTCNKYLVPWIREFNPGVFDLSQPAPLFKLVYRKARDETLVVSRYDACSRYGIMVNAAELYENLNLQMPPDTPEWILLETKPANDVPEMTGTDLFGLKEAS